MSGSTIEEYTEVTRIFDDSPIDAIEINISCPNVKEGGVAFGNDPDMSARVVEACRSVTNKPLITKLSPNQTDIAYNAKRCIEAGTDGFAVINTLMGMAIDINSRKPVIGNNQGGLSGPAIKPIALLKVHQVYQVCKEHNIPIIGQGGVCSGEDALEFIIAGASAVGIGTGLYYDPLICAGINQTICDYLTDNNFSHLSECSGQPYLKSMKEDSKKVLDKQLKKDRHLLLYSVFAFIIFTNIVYILYSPATTTTVSGITLAFSALTTETESNAKMKVLLDTGDTVLVTIPGQDFFKEQVRVVLSKSVSVMGKVTYEFNDYEKSFKELNK